MRKLITHIEHLNFRCNTMTYNTKLDVNLGVQTVNLQYI